MTPEERIHKIIDSCLEANGSWREVFNELAILFTFNYDLDLESTVLVDYVLDELSDKGIEADPSTVAGYFVSFLSVNNYALTVDWVSNNKDLVIETLDNNGGDGSDDYAEFVSK